MQELLLEMASMWFDHITKVRTVSLSRPLSLGLGEKLYSLKSILVAISPLQMGCSLLQPQFSPEIDGYQRLPLPPLLLAMDCWRGGWGENRSLLRSLPSQGQENSWGNHPCWLGSEAPTYLRLSSDAFWLVPVLRSILSLSPPTLHSFPSHPLILSTTRIGKRLYEDRGRMLRRERKRKREWRKI